jgi:hypothetical protein
MILKFQFFLPSSQGIVEKVAIRIGEESGCKTTLHREGEILEVYYKGEGEELEKVARLIGEEMPVTLFLKGAEVERVEEMKGVSPANYPPLPRLNLPPCPRCHREMTDPNSPHYRNFFHHCNICGYPLPTPLQWSSTLLPLNPSTPTDKGENFAIPLEENSTISPFPSQSGGSTWEEKKKEKKKEKGEGEKWEKSTSKITHSPNLNLKEGDGQTQFSSPNSPFVELFEKLGVHLLEEKEIQITTMNGKFRVVIDEKVGEAPIIVARDLGAVERYFLVERAEITGLGAIEKPAFHLPPTLNFRKEFGSSRGSCLVKLPDCGVLTILMATLPDEVQLLGLYPTDVTPHLNFPLPEKLQTPPVAVGSNSRRGEPLVEKGERGFIPVYLPSPDWKTPPQIAGVCNNLGAYFAQIDGHHLVKILPREQLPPHLSPKEAYPHFAILTGVIEANGVENRQLLCYALLKGEGSGVYLYSPHHGFSPYLTCRFKFSSFGEIFSQIEKMGETGEKLISNFRKKMPELVESLLQREIAGEGGIYYLWGVMGVLLEMGENWREGVKNLLHRVREVIGKKGPRIDYRGSKTSGIDPFWVIRTAISFRLAGVAPEMIAYGVVESFAEYLNNLYLALEREIDLGGAVIAGEMAQGLLLSKLYTYLERNFPVYLPWGTPTDGEAMGALGSLLIASKVEESGS